ncbi:MAG: peptidylprolyl isomerase [Spirochaetes bacterium]|nr:peptidylprolyl isomerase [Spirochaetota bacterium]
MKKVLFCLITILFFIISCKEDKSINLTVARFDNGEITISETITRYNKLSSEEKKALETRDDYFRFVRRIALEKIIIHRAKEQNLDQAEDFKKISQRIKSRVGYEIIRQKNILDKVKINEADYQPYLKTFELYQIVKRTDILDEQKIKQSRQLLEKLAKQIKTLEEFKKFAQEYSDDVTGQDGGYVGNIRLGIMDEEIDKIMKKIKINTVSEVIETYAGYHIIMVNVINKTDMEELTKDQQLYNAIYQEKTVQIENQWYDKLLKDSKLKINFDLLLESQNEDVVIVEYNDKKITKQEISNKVNDLRQDGTFPQPTETELQNLVKNMALQLILEQKIESNQVTALPDYQKQVTTQINQQLISRFIDNNVIVPEISEQDIRDFYQNNLTTLFTFKTETGADYIQPMEEVEKFITQKISAQYVQNARYELYRKLVADHQLEIYDQYLDQFIQEVQLLSEKGK